MLFRSSRPLLLDATNNIISTQIDLTSTNDITGILPIANGGTNSSTALSNDRVMISNAGSVVEQAAMTNGQLMVDRKSTRLNSSHIPLSRMPSSA